MIQNIILCMHFNDKDYIDVTELMIAQKCYKINKNYIKRT